MSFAERHGLWSAEQADAAQAVAAQIVAAGLGVVRFTFVSPHGLLLGKTIVAEEAVRLLSRGVTAATTLLMKDLSGRTAFPVYEGGGGFGRADLAGAGDMVLLADPLTFRILPWAPHTGWVLCDLYLPDGTPMPLCTRRVMRGALQRLHQRGLHFVAGLEVECHIFRQTSPDAAAGPPQVAPLNDGSQYLSELRYDEVDPLLEVLRGDLQGLGLPLRSLEIEFGPSQFEFTFAPTQDLAPADLMALFRSAVKQVCRRHGHHASFMCRPKLAGVISSGWHLHQSLGDSQGRNLFAAADNALSPLARGWLGGLLAHAAAATAFSTPTINGYRRYRPQSNAPDRACWARDNRGVMIRVLGGPGDPATRLENRAGEPAANPYLYMAAQITAGLDGLDRDLSPGPSADEPYRAPAPALPRSLPEALAALRDSACFAEGFGAFFIDYYLRLKQAELDRFHAEVSDWEQREYFALL
jgi:glutamine synthetase